MTTSNDPDEIRADIERTRAALSDDVDDLAESVKPKNVAGRQVGKVKEAASNIKDRVMGSDDDDDNTGAVGTVTDKTSSTRDAVADRAYAAKDAVADKAYATKDTASERASEAREAVRQAPRRMKRRAQGNPLAAGVVAFGLGMLVSSLIPSSEKEREAVSQLQDNLEPVKEKATEVARDIGESLKPAAQEAAESVKSNGSRRRRDRQAGRSVSGSGRQSPGSGLQGDGAAAEQLSSFVTVVDLLRSGGGSTTSLQPGFRQTEAGYPKRHVGVRLVRSSACAVMEQPWPCSGTDR